MYVYIIVYIYIWNATGIDGDTSQWQYHWHDAKADHACTKGHADSQPSLSRCYGPRNIHCFSGPKETPGPDAALEQTCHLNMADKSTVLYMDLSWQEKRAEVGLTIRQFASWEQWPSCRDSASDSQVEKLRSSQHFAIQHPLKWVVLCPPTKHQPKNTFHHKSNLDQTSRLMSREQSDEISRVYLLITMERNHFDR